MTDWQDLTEEDAIEAAVAEHGKDPTASVAYCALEDTTAGTVRTSAAGKGR
ncbi:hypothetical protein [Sinorhizobium meliloti]|uniref:hypothetical protein n=1 Tax=Rhizobium meliloti TaxID=382 RepID=UPI0013E4092C|nr:hypothetical protein [Sinorhizobium meliloti]